MDYAPKKALLPRKAPYHELREPRMTDIPFPPTHPCLLTPADNAALTTLFRQGTPENTLRAYERDLVYITAWKRAAFAADLAWPEEQEVALRFVLDHARDMREAPADDIARHVAQTLAAAGLRRSLARPAPSTLDRRVASWCAFHRMRNLPSPFDTPLLRETRAKARRAAKHRPQQKSARPITRDVLETLLATCGPDLRSARDAAILLTGWASGGRRRSELAGLMVTDVDRSAFADQGFLRLLLLETKTTTADRTPTLLVKGRAAEALEEWLVRSEVNDGSLFRAISKSGRVLPRGLSADGIAHVLRSRLAKAGLPKGYVSMHGLRSGFLTQAALDGAPLAAAMRLSLHRSPAQAQRYYADCELLENPAADLLDNNVPPAPTAPGGLGKRRRSAAGAP
jgi:integrase